ncbi:class I SAM-dependent methyltransferase [Flavivirga spongiicola]|uniref:Class I SAM-dependent methyltransferase n=1 Tax=Flavivirga spongiicola TaxID=421621 RepID=A0ABU7XZQ3_9FLAO|nr:class I SAM-dependent methyltransferase [Flavivirga sp. MEBiC05379]MDO5980915.1 methyltransferase domain-containing protein [Flavivirga sp. MEBiC05379]
MTNIKPEDLNYHYYSTEQYDRDIVSTIPGYKVLHNEIARIAKNLPPNPRILELGVGTGNTTLAIAQNTKNPNFTLVDFSEKMLNGAKHKLDKLNCKYLLEDYSAIELPQKHDAVICVIGFHHQESDKNKKTMILKIYNSLKRGGLFILGDLMTYDNKEFAAINEAKHYHFLVENAEGEEMLKEWAYHHKYLNSLASKESHIKWMNDVGFSTEVIFEKFNTVLILGKKI